MRAEDGDLGSSPQYGLEIHSAAIPRMSASMSAYCRRNRRTQSGSYPRILETTEAKSKDGLFLRFGHRDPWIWMLDRKSAPFWFAAVGLRSY